MHVRVYAAQVGDGFAVQVARSLDEVDHTLHRLGLYMLIIGLVGVGIAGGLGLVVAQPRRCGPSAISRQSRRR